MKINAELQKMRILCGTILAAAMAVSANAARAPFADGMTYVVAVNYSPIAAQCRIETEGRIGRVFGNGTFKDGVLSLGANDGVVFEVSHK